MKNWSKSKSILDIQIFSGFIYFYWYFIKSFYKIAKSLIIILKKIFIALSINSNLLSNVINKDGAGGRENNKVKNLLTFSMPKKLIAADHIIFDVKKNFLSFIDCIYLGINYLSFLYKILYLY